jgi:hypothetical protein
MGAAAPDIAPHPPAADRRNRPGRASHHKENIMRLSWKAGLLAALLAAGLLTLAGTPARTADDKKPDAKADADKVPFAGNWRVTVVFGGVREEIPFLLKIEGKDGKPTVALLDSVPDLKDTAKLAQSHADAKAVHFTIDINGNPLAGTAYAPKDGNEKESKKLLGVANFRNQKLPLILDLTEAKELEQPFNKMTDGAQEFQKAEFTIKDDKEKSDALKALLEKSDGKPIAVAASAALMQLRAKTFEKDAEFKVSADKAIKVAADYGPELEQNAAVGAASALLRADKGPELALVYARSGEKGLAKDAPAAQVVPTLKVLSKALQKSKKDDEAKMLDTRIAKLDEELDHDFEKTAIPFKPDAFKGRKKASNRVALVELFTGAQCPPCVAADIAFDAAAQTYKSKDVVFLEYHLHIPGPDPLTNADSEARQKLYGNEIRGTPTCLVNGKTTDSLGGGKVKVKDPMSGKEFGAEISYGKLHSAIDEALEAESQGDVLLTAKRNGDKIDVEAKIVDLKKTGDKVRLHFVLVEDVVRYPGNNGQRLHHEVVRAFPGGVEGIEMKEGTSKQKATIDLAEVTKTLTSYLEEANKKRAFFDDERPLALKKLKVIAFIQDDDSKEIFQAASADVPEAK